ncbi:hypothetical protein QBC42DRAFT_326296 [Cladorrhinum samala]|uniref:Uncharacterized protein n=1 Tax=Cladorrhinum samala TaxID=585594 RepID=A0AAV9HT20_9PEZI|nr:hypothetical protein QBC42DRAFT_326296 [Cladorrhinum samala]
MSWFKTLLDSTPALDKSKSLEAASEELSHYIPESFTLAELLAGVEETLTKAELSKPKATKETQKLLLAILAALRQTTTKIQPISDESKDSTHALALIISRLIAPIVPPSEENDTRLHSAFNESLVASVTTQTRHTLAVSNLGLRALSALVTLSTIRLDPECLLTVISFTDPSQEWSTSESAQLASAILSTQKISKEEFIPQQVLQRYLRPLFSKSKPASVTPSGRKTAYPDQSREHGGGMPDDISETKPWKFTDLRAVPIVAWAVTEANDSLISSAWPLCIPVLLTLTDDNSTPIRARGLRILTTFLTKFPPKTLDETGLNKVFEDAIIPTLSYLPSLTPVDESAKLLTPAYEALLALASKYTSSRKAKYALLDKILREGVLNGHFHAKDHLRIVQILNHQTVHILNEMGVHAVKHLKDLIPILSVTLTDPFASSSPQTLLSAILALQAVLSNCWPRIYFHQDSILNGLVLCWLNNNSSSPNSNPPNPEIESQLITTTKAFCAVLSATKNETKPSPSLTLSQAFQPLIAKDPSLAKLFSVSAPAQP